MEASGSSGSPFYRVENDSYIKGKEYNNMSARKLAAALWEINGLKQHIFAHKRHIKDSADLATSRSLACDQRIDRSNVGGHSHNHSHSHSHSHRRCSAILQKLEIAQGLQTIRKLNSIEVASGMQGTSVKSGLKEVSKSVIASKELVKVLFRIVSQEEQHSSSSRMTLVSALRVELERARLQVDRLVQREAQLAEAEAEAEAKAGWKRVSSLWKEVEIERKRRRRAERLNKKLGMKLADARARAMKEAEGERRARQVLEHELATDRVVLQELKQEAAKAREELDNERQMLQLADILREERVQMKLAEARYEYEEKNAALERLKTHLIIASYNKQQQQQYEDEDEDGDEGEESELHSIELNMDNGNSFPPSMDQVFKGRRSLSDNIQWETICLQRNTPPSNFNGLLGTSSKQSDENDFNNEHGHEFKRNNNNNNTIRRSSTTPPNSSPLRKA